MYEPDHLSLFHSTQGNSNHVKEGTRKRMLTDRVTYRANAVNINLSLLLGIPYTALRDVLHKLLRSHAYKIKFSCEIEENHPSKSVKYADFVLNEVDEQRFRERIFSTEDVLLHMYGHAKRHEYRICGEEQLHEIFENLRDMKSERVL
jgi:hypothetical protein